MKPDVIVVGAGSGGGVLAARLSEDPSRSVLLLEAGPDFPDEAERPPAFLVGGNAIGEAFAGAGPPVPALDWGYEPEPLANGRRIRVFRGRLVGGSSMINGCVAVRGKPSDFDRWASLGAGGWAWDDVRLAFERVEAEIPIKRYRREEWQPVARAFVDGFAELGFRAVEDVNEPDAWAGVVGPWPQSRRNEVRQGTLVTYLRRARPRPNLEIRGDALVDTVLLEGGRAAGVRLASDEELRAPLVVLCGGAYGSPAILLRSGIGPRDELRELGIEPAVDLPVGRGLMDHPQCAFLLETTPGLAAMSGPAFACVARGDGWFAFPLALDEEAGLCAVAFALASEDDSGTVRLLSRDPAAPLRIEHPYQAAIDRGEFAGAWETFARLARTAPFAGSRLPDEGRELRDVLLERMGTAQHAVGGCAIGRVLDPELRVLGVEGLRVADASVFPANVTNNLNLTCCMIGERAAELLG